MDLSDTQSELSSVMEVEWPEKATKPEFQKESASNIQQEPKQEYAELMRTGHNLRQRQAKTYLAPWQIEQQRKRSEKSKVVIKIEDESDDQTGKAKQLAESPLARTSPSSDDGISMLLQAAVLLERSDIPCNAFGCPIKEPHSEGLYLHPQAVPNSSMANAFFAPSIPPPSVVEAFNNITGRPSLRDLHTKDYFFDYHTAPCRPSKHLSKVAKTVCRSNNCGVVGQPHKKGIFLQDGLDPSYNLARRVNHMFGISNPPAKVWDAGIRYVDGVGNLDDYELVEDFRAHHVRLADNATNRKEFYRWQQHRRADRP